MCENRQVGSRAGSLAALLCGCHGTGQAPERSNGSLDSCPHSVHRQSWNPLRGGFPDDRVLFLPGCFPEGLGQCWQSNSYNKVRLQRADLSLNRHDALTKLRAISRFPDEETEAHRLCNSTRVTELGTSRAETCPGWIRGCSPVICARSFPAALLLALTMGLSSEALLIPQRPHGPRDQIPGSDTQVMPYSRSAPGKI